MNLKALGLALLALPLGTATAETAPSNASPDPIGDPHLRTGTAYTAPWAVPHLRTGVKHPAPWANTTTVVGTGTVAVGTARPFRILGPANVAPTRAETMFPAAMTADPPAETEADGCGDVGMGTEDPATATEIIIVPIGETTCTKAAGSTGAGTTGVSTEPTRSSAGGDVPERTPRPSTSSTTPTGPRPSSAPGTTSPVSVTYRPGASRGQNGTETGTRADTDTGRPGSPTDLRPSPTSKTCHGGADMSILPVGDPEATPGVGGCGAGGTGSGGGSADRGGGSGEDREGDGEVEGSGSGRVRVGVALLLGVVLVWV